MAETVGKWTCPKCNAENEPDFTHCRVCAQKNPALPETEVICPKCGYSTSKTCCPICNSELFLQL